MVREFSEAETAGERSTAMGGWVGHDEMKQEIAAVTSRRVLETAAFLSACRDIVYRWVLLFLDTSSRLRANQSHTVCANGRRPQTVSLLLRVSRCAAVASCSLPPRRFRRDVDNSPTQRYSGQGTLQDESDARYYRNLWSRRRATPTPRLVPPRCTAHSRQDSHTQR
jgi:hypothetical protein